MSLQPHRHHVDLEDTFDFINTLEHSAVADTDHIPTAEEALGWLVERGVLHAEAVERAGSPDEVLGRVRAARRALRELADAVYARRAPAADSLDEVNRTLRAREVTVVEPAPDGVRIDHRHEGHPLDDALARLAKPLVDELAGGRPERLRVCANDACRWVFFDASPTGRRRWCSMASCGNRAKAARHRARKRKDSAT